MTNTDLNMSAEQVIPSSGNVFADLGFEDAGLELAKAKLALAISHAIGERKLTQAEAGEITGLDQPRVSAILRGRLGGFSIERLFRTLNALGQDVDISVRASHSFESAQVTVRIESAAG